jgi:hypothetical protein
MPQESVTVKTTVEQAPALKTGTKITKIASVSTYKAIKRSGARYSGANGSGFDSNIMAPELASSVQLIISSLTLERPSN